MLARIAVPVALCLALALSGLPAAADPGVPVFHDREVKRDPAGDVQGDGTTPIDIRKVQYDHYKTGDNERFVVTVRFGSRVRNGSELNWGSSTGAGGYPLEFRATVGGGFRLERDNHVVRHPRARRTVDGRQWSITIPWGKLGSPGKLVGLHFWAELWKPGEVGPGIDQAFKDRAVLN
jgi:hypothetical protein